MANKPVVLPEGFTKVGGFPVKQNVELTPSFNISGGKLGISLAGKEKPVEDPELKALEKQGKKLDIATKQKNLAKVASETGKIPAAQTGYLTMANASLKDYQDLKTELANKTLTYDDIRQAFARTPTDQTAIINNILFNGTDAWLRIQTGAQANPSEISREMAKFQPKPWDSDKVIDYKLKSLFENRLGLYKQTLEENAGQKASSTDKKTTSAPASAKKAVKIEW